MKKKIILTEQELSNILKESIKAVLEENERKLLTEMAFPRKDYKQKVASIIPQILENWCLVRYCSITNRTECKQHWSDELRGYISTASRFSIRGNDSKQARTKVLNEIWNENDYNLPQYLNLTIANKFIVENIDITSQQYRQVLSDNISSINNLFQIILSRDINIIQEYVNNI